MTMREMWVGSVFVVEWDLVDPAGEPVATADVAGVVTRPNGSTAAMVIDHDPDSNTWRASYAAAAAGRHGYAVTATIESQPAGSIGGEFTVSRAATGAAPITVALDTAVGQVRLLTTDVDEAFPLHTDAEITAFLALEGGNVKRAAAAQLETIATSETLVSKKITTQDLSVDGPAVAEDLRKRAKLLRDQVRQDVVNDRDDTAYDDGYGFDSVDFNRYPSYRSGW